MVRSLVGLAVAALLLSSCAPPVPMPPSGLVTTPGDGVVGVSWTPSRDEDLRLYNIYWGVTPDGLTQHLSVSAPLSQVSVFNLTNGTTYFFAVDAQNIIGQRSGRSQLVNGTPNNANALSPAILNTVPQDGMQNISVGDKLRIEFSEQIDVSTVQVTVEPALNLGPPLWLVGNTILTFPDAAPFAGATLYRFNVQGKDMSGLNLAIPSSFSFTTELHDVTPPSIKDISPSDGQMNVSLQNPIAISFSEPMQPGTIGFPITISPDFPWIEAWNPAHDALILFPTTPLTLGMEYTVTISTAALDLAGNNLAAPFVSHFTTVPAPDTIAPNITFVTPEPGQLANANPPTVVIRFSEPVDRGSAQSGFSLRSRAGNTAGTFTWNLSSTQMTFQPASPFIPGETVLLAEAAYRDYSGNVGATYQNYFVVP